MNARSGLSRRQALTTVAGGLAVASGLRGRSMQAWAQAPKRIEQLGPELDMIISTTEPIQELASGFGGDPSLHRYDLEETRHRRPIASFSGPSGQVGRP